MISVGVVMTVYLQRVSVGAWARGPAGLRGLGSQLNDVRMA
jgi:hypothetical protein